MRHVPASEQGWRGYESLYLPSPLLTKEGNRKDPGSSIKNVEDDRKGKTDMTDSGCRWLFSD